MGAARSIVISSARLPMDMTVSGDMSMVYQLGDGQE
jgi:hypothetical protein